LFVSICRFLGDLHGVRALVASGVDLGGCDYDGRTPLHLAASEGQLSIVKYLAVHGVELEPVDRWGGTPLSDAQKGNHTSIVQFLTTALTQSRNGKLHRDSPLIKNLINTPIFSAADKKAIQNSELDLNANTNTNSSSLARFNSNSNGQGQSKSKQPVSEN
jgi:ankyrin repeat protein